MKKNEGLDGSEAFELDLLQKVVNHPLSQKTDALFESVIPRDTPPPEWLSANTMTFANVKPGSTATATETAVSDDGLSLDEGIEFDLGDLGGESPAAASATDEGLDLSLDDGLDLSLGGDDDALTLSESADEGMTLAYVDDGGLELTTGDEVVENLGELDFGNLNLDAESEQSHAGTAPSAESLDEDFLLGGLEEAPATQSSQTRTRHVDIKAGLNLEESELSDDVKNKLKEIDAIMDSDSRVNIKAPSPSPDLDEPLVADQLSDVELGFNSDAEETVDEDAPSVVAQKPAGLKQEEKPKRKKKEVKESSSEDIREISGAYSGELERLQATISNLRSDRDELLSRIQVLEDEKVMHNRQSLSMRAELDERKIELTIIRRKLNDEIAELKDKMRVHEERRLILEEKNRVLQAELDKAGQKNKLDVKKVQLRERELEQKLELLKADAETQIRHRDLKILELKRRIDAMEFDMESMNSQEKRSVESRFELEDKLEKAIRTLRSAITVLEDENDSKALETLKKNIDI